MVAPHSQADLNICRCLLARRTFPSVEFLTCFPFGGGTPLVCPLSYIKLLKLQGAGGEPEKTLTPHTPTNSGALALAFDDGFDDGRRRAGEDEQCQKAEEAAAQRAAARGEGGRRRRRQ